MFKNILPLCLLTLSASNLFAAGHAVPLRGIPWTPPTEVVVADVIKADTTNELYFKFQTGPDDKRNKEMVNIAVTLLDGTEFHFPSVNNGVGYPSYSWNTIPLPLGRKIYFEDVYSVTVEHSAMRAALTDIFLGPDNWDLWHVELTDEKGKSKNLAKSLRLSGSQLYQTFIVNYPRSGVHTLSVRMHTGEDDLRGGDNLHATVFFRDGSSQYVPNLNKGATFPKNSQRQEDIILKKAVNAADIVSIELHKDAKGGFEGDNWDMNYLRISANDGTFLGQGAPKRFTGDSKKYLLPLYPH